MRTDRYSFSSADSTGAQATPASVQNIVAQINSINEQITKTTAEKNAFQANIDVLKNKMEMAVCLRDCKKGNEPWVDVNGVCWCASDSTSARRDAAQKIALAPAAIKTYDDKIAGLNAQLKTLNDSLPSLAKSDPSVIAANAAAEAAIVKAQGSSKAKLILWGTVGMVFLTLIGFWAYRRAVRK